MFQLHRGFHFSRVSYYFILYYVNKKRQLEVIYYGYQILCQKRKLHYQVVLAFTCLRSKKYGTIPECREYDIFRARSGDKKVASPDKLTRRYAFSILATRVPRSALPCPLYRDVNLARTPRPVHRKPVPLSLPSPPSPCRNQRRSFALLRWNATLFRPDRETITPAWRVYAEPSGDTPFNSGMHPPVIFSI